MAGLASEEPCDPDRVWLLYGEKASGKAAPYNDAVEERSCFGWIDGQTEGHRRASVGPAVHAAARESSLVGAQQGATAAVDPAGRMTKAGLAVAPVAELDKAFKVRRISRRP